MIVLKKIFIKEIAKHTVPTKYRVLFTLKIIIGVKIGVKPKNKEPESAFLLHSSALIVLNYKQDRSFCQCLSSVIECLEPLENMGNIVQFSFCLCLSNSMYLYDIKITFWGTLWGIKWGKEKTDCISVSSFF